MDKSPFKNRALIHLALFSLLILVPLFSIANEENRIDSQNASPDSSFHMKIMTDGTSPLQTITLTEAVYLENQARITEVNPLPVESYNKQQSQRQRFRNRLLRRKHSHRSIHYGYERESLREMLTVRDASGVSLPFIIDEKNTIEKRLRRTLPLFSLYQPRQLLESTDKTVFKYNLQNQLIEISSKTELENKRVIGYLLDLGEYSNMKNSELSFELSKANQTSFLKFNIDQSDDLKNWRRVSTSEVLAQLIQNNLSSQKNTSSLSGINSRYLRITLLDPSPSFSIKSVVQTYSDYQTKSSIWSNSWEAKWNQQEKGLILELSPVITYTALQFNLENSPSILRGNIFARTTADNYWYPLKSFDVFHIKDGNRTIINNQVSLSRLKASHLKIKFDYPNNIDLNPPISLSLAWRPQQLTFLANGNTPYEIVIDSHLNHSQQTNDERLITKIKSQLTTKAGIAQLGDSYSVKKATLNKPNNHWPKIGLWLALLIGILVLLWMLKSMFGQLR